jgi:hypothetical protein
MRKLKYLILLAIGACGGSDDEACDPVANTGCEDGLTCEAVTGDGTPVCAAPLVLRGEVFDLGDASAVAGARVVALDVNGTPVSSVATTDAEGNYELSVPATRTAEGTVIGFDVTLRADAAGYASFPSGIRQSLPISTGTPTTVDDKLVVSSALTTIGLIALPEGSGTGTISGTVAVPASRAGVLVVAEIGEPATGYTAIADTDGGYKIFNLPVGDYNVTAYARGGNYEIKTATLTVEARDATVNLAITSEAAATVSGSVNPVNPGEGSVTSVIFVVESTFNADIGRGEAPPGLRAPDPGIDPNVTNDWSITGVPAGRYVVLAAFENDNFVRDPDTSQGGTDTLHIEVAVGETKDITEGFKITGALDVISPGAGGIEGVASAPTLSWVDDAGEQTYHVQVFDALGNMVWETTAPGETSNDPEVLYEGPFDDGMIYQFRATSLDGSGVPLSATEDLKGVFFKSP